MKVPDIERDRSWEKIQHLNAALRAIRNVARLITREKDRGRLLKSICEKLIETRGYHNAWIALLDEKRRLVATVESGLDKDFLPMVKRLERGELPICGQKAMLQSNVVVTQDPLSYCMDCQLAVNYEGASGMTVRLEHGGRVYGLLIASIPRDFASDKQEQSLFNEIAVDIGFALRNIELEEERSRMERELQRAHDRLAVLVEERTKELARRNEELGAEIIAHERTEEALRQSRERYKELYDESKKTDEVYRSLLHTSADAIVIYDMEGKARYINPSFTEIFGWTMEEVEGKLIQFVPEPERETTMARIKEIIEEGKGIQGFETKRTTKDGRSIDVSISGSRYYDHEGEPAGMLAILRDTSERKILEAQLRHAHKMEAVGRLAGGIAHDFNNILQAISGYIQILLMEKEPGEPDYSKLEAIEKSAQRASDLTRQLLIFSRKVESKLGSVDLNREIVHVSKLLERTIPKMIRIELHLSEDTKIINADPVRLEQIMMNLGVNARDAMPDGGNLTFETENVILDEEYCKAHLGAKPGEYVLLSISDTGQGMDKETVNHIFEPFFTTKEVGRGTGLGLAMVYGIVKSHGAYIMCDSEPGMGTTFKIYFPVVLEESIMQRPERVKNPGIPGGRETILLVDDEEIILDIGMDMLERFGYRVITAENGERAIEIFSKAHRAGGREGEEKKKIDLVILDVGMQGMGGHKCLKKLLKIDPKIKIIIASGYPANGRVRDTLDSGAAGFIGKPYRLADMLRKVREVLDAGEREGELGNIGTRAKLGD